jgi:hypothetical protein
MSSQIETTPSVPKTPFLAVSALFLGVAALVGVLAIKPLGAAELLGLLACVASATVFATVPFTIDLTRRLDARRHASDPAQTAALPAPEIRHQSGDKPALDAEALVTRIATAVEARLDASLETRLAAALPAFREQLASALTTGLAAAEETRRAEIQAAIAATTPPRALDADNIAPPAAASTGAAGKPRLGRGLLGLMHAPAALAAKPAAPSAGDSREPATDDDRAAA